MYESSENLITIFDQRAESDPALPAVRGNGFSYSYREFRDHSCRFAQDLLKCGVRKGDYAGICLERSAEMVVGIFGILRAGAAYVPADPHAPASRIQEIYADAGIRYVVTTKSLAGYIESLGFTALVPDLMATGPGDIVPLAADPEQPAYILFTSGSTGKPKGVVVPHRAVVNLIRYMQAEYPLDRGDTVLLKSPYTFDGSVWELFGWFLMGGTLFVADPGAEKDPARLLEICKKEKIAFLFFVPAMLRTFLEYFSMAPDPSLIRSIQWVSVGGEVLPVPLVERFHELFGRDKARLINVYGPTETTVYATTYLCDPTRGEEKIPVGFPVTNDKIYILNEELKPVQQGDEGEICIGGTGVALGYLNDPQLSAAKFVDDPFSGGRKMYRTGDIGRQLTNGAFDFIGRRDFQVKLRGLRIELGEIEHALGKIEEVAEGVVIFAKDHHGDDALIAYVRLQISSSGPEEKGFFPAGNTLDSNLREALGKTLPQYMIPAHFVITDKFQLTSNGKVDRSVLPTVSSLFIEKADDAFHPRNDEETRIYSIWKEVLGRESIGEHENFLEAGGHSIKAIQLIIEIKRAFGAELSLQELYREMTLKKMSEWLANRYPAPAKEPNPEHHANAIGTIHPITIVQEEMWILHSADPGGLTHNIQIEFFISGKITLSTFIRILKETVRAEEMFNSAFPCPYGRPVRQTVAPVAFEVPVIDLSHLPETERENSYREIVFQNGQIRFDLEKPPLFSFRMVILGPGEMRLLFAVHHIIFDGWSLFLFMERLKKRFEGEKEEIRPGIHGEFARKYNQYVREKRWNPEMEFWKKRLNGIPEKLNLPKRKDFDPLQSTQNGERHWWQLPPGLSRRIDEVSQSSGVTPFISLISAYQLALGAFARQHDVVVGTPYANRLDPDVAGLIGYYTNMVSIRGILKPGDSPHSYLLRTNHETIEAFSNAAVPFGEIAREIRGGAQLGINPVFNAIFVLQNWPHTDPQFPGFTLRQREIGNNTSKTDIMLNVERSGDHYVCWLEYDTNLFDFQIIQKISESFTSILEGMLDDLHQPLQPLVAGKTAGNPVSAGPSCIIIGNGRLAIQCANLLLDSGFRIATIITREKTLSEFAGSNGIPLLDHPGRCVNHPGVDHIFSINNGHILKQPFTGLAGNLVVNYHDAPLPRYAGLYATHWALLQGETEHGVTWHLVTDEIDGGNLLAMERVHILSSETVETLNARCFEAALRSFSTLLTAFRENRLSPQLQNPSGRSYFAQHDRPEHFGAITGNMTIKEADLLLRATQCGNQHDNEFLLPFFLPGNRIFFIHDAKILQAPEGETPGSIAETGGQKAIVLKDGSLVPVEISDQHGKKADPAEILQTGDFIRQPDENTFRRIREIFRKTARFEPFWKSELERSDFVEWPSFPEAEPGQSVVLKIPGTILNRISALIPEQPMEKTLTALLSLFFLKMNGQSTGSFGFSGARLPEEIKGAELFFNPWIPLNLVMNPEGSATENLRDLTAQIILAEKALTFTRSMPSRYPSLRAKEPDHPGFVIFETIIPEAALKEGLNAIGICGDQLRIVAPEGSSIQGAGAVAGGFLMFIENFCAHPEGEIRNMELATAASMTSHQSKIHEHSEPIPDREDVLKQFLRASALYPENPAVIETGKSHDYRRFKDDIEWLAARMASLGVLPGNRIAIVARRDYPYFVSVMATLWCGGCFIPLDPEIPENRRELIFADAGVSLILTTGEEDHAGFHILRVNPDDHAGEREKFQPAEVAPEAPAYIIYTSGTTGLPKGVVISRNALATFIAGALSIYKPTSSDRILQFCNLSFDASIEEIFLAFCTGASLYPRDEEMLKPEKLIGFTLQQSLTVWDLPTAFWRQVIQSEEYRNLSESSLSLVIIGGEAVLPGDIARWESRHPSHRLFNTYGPTETTVVAIAHEVKRGDSAGSVPIGRPLPGYRLFVVNRQLKCVLPGMTGELLIAGDGVASGYVNRESETHEAFIRFCPPGSTDAVQCYRTGDLVYAGAGGNIFYAGRNDHQIKIRGFRTEPGEIEKQISRIDGVQSCVVVADKPDGRDFRLTAFICSDRHEIRGEVRNILSTTLPTWMIPERIMTVREIPLTINGKADRAALLKMVGQERDPDHEIASLPFTPDEILVYELWKKILKLNHFSIDDDFFELGGHSLKAVEFMSEIRKRRGVDISIASLIRNPTVRKFGALLSSGEHGTYWQCMVPIRTEGMKTPLFLIHGAGLNILLYQSLTRYLKPGRPIYALQAKGLDGKTKISTSVEEMAGDYLREIEAIRPSGPVMLLGFSLGGFTAFEIARLLTEKGREVTFCGVIDAVTALTKSTDSPMHKKISRVKNLTLKCCFNLKLIVKNLFKPESTILKSKIQILGIVFNDKMIRLGLKKKGEHRIEYINGEPQYLTNHARMLMWQDLKHFLLVPAGIKVDLFRAGVATFYISERGDYGWSRYAKKGVNVHTIPAEHSLLFADPNDKLFAKILDERLDEEEQNKTLGCHE